jgi:hypothetical protein
MQRELSHTALDVEEKKSCSNYCFPLVFFFYKKNVIYILPSLGLLSVLPHILRNNVCCFSDANFGKKTCLGSHAQLRLKIMHQCGTAGFALGQRQCVGFVSIFGAFPSAPLRRFDEGSQNPFIFYSYINPPHARPWASLLIFFFFMFCFLLCGPHEPHLISLVLHESMPLSPSSPSFFCFIFHLFAWLGIAWLDSFLSTSLQFHMKTIFFFLNDLQNTKTPKLTKNIRK